MDFLKKIHTHTKKTLSLGFTANEIILKGLVWLLPE